MAILRANYDLGKNIDEVWYQSSNVIYSLFEENHEENKGDLIVVFKGGKRYIYKDVSFMDYLYFKNATLNDGSSGKAFNEYIIKRYKGEKMEDADLNAILEEISKPDPKETTYFIHGDGEVDEVVFTGMYANTINYVLETSPESKFAVMFSNAYGMRCAKYLIDCGVDPSRVTIYMKDSDIYKLDEQFCECCVVKIEDVRYDDDFIASEIRKRSFEDIAYISPETLTEIAKVSKSAYIILSRRML